MKNFRNILFIFILSALLIVTISSSWAGKPSKPTPTDAYGYAKLDDSQNIRSDNGNQYADCSKDGEDFVSIEYYPNDGSYQRINVVLGKMESFATLGTVSSRRLNLCFNVLGGTKSNYTGNEAVYDILGEYYDTVEGKKIARSTNTGYIDGDSVHAQIYSYVAGGSEICFLVDPGTDCSSDKAIDDIKVNQFYNDEEDSPNLNYWDSSEYGEGGQIIYELIYTAGFNVVTSDKRTWTVTPKDGTVDLGIRKYRGTKGNAAWNRIVLATYDAVPFTLTVSLDPILQAPRKHNTISTTWGETKTALNR